MSLAVTDISALFLDNDSNREVLTEINKLLRTFIKNDLAMTSEKQVAPTLWTCKWLNDKTIPGYSKGDAVWVNTNSVTDILRQKYDEISSMVTNNPVLGPEFGKIDEGNQSAVNAFFKKAIVGAVNPQVSALYYLENITDKVQIRICQTPNNKDYPSCDTWKDFYISNTYEDNTKLMMDALSTILLSCNTQHLQEYHLSDFSDDRIKEFQFFKNNPSEISAVKKQYFYDHTYCEDMTGFDFVRDWRVESDGRWSRLWNSGYLEQGGSVSNSGSRFLTVTLPRAYNYPLGSNFYQEGFETFAEGQSINGDLSEKFHYTVSVTPVLKSGILPFQGSPATIQSAKIFASNDVANLSNSKFSIVNIDTGKMNYSKYNWYTSGYTTVQVEN